MKEGFSFALTAGSIVAKPCGVAMPPLAVWLHSPSGLWSQRENLRFLDNFTNEGTILIVKKGEANLSNKNIIPKELNKFKMKDKEVVVYKVL